MLILTKIVITFQQLVSNELMVLAPITVETGSLGAWKYTIRHKVAVTHAPKRRETVMKFVNREFHFSLDPNWINWNTLGRKIAANFIRKAIQILPNDDEEFYYVDLEFFSELDGELRYRRSPRTRISR